MTVITRSTELDGRLFQLLLDGDAGIVAERTLRCNGFGEGIHELAGRGYLAGTLAHSRLGFKITALALSACGKAGRVVNAESASSGKENRGLSTSGWLCDKRARRAQLRCQAGQVTRCAHPTARQIPTCLPYVGQFVSTIE